MREITQPVAVNRVALAVRPHCAGDRVGYPQSWFARLRSVFHSQWCSLGQVESSPLDRPDITLIECSLPRLDDELGDAEPGHLDGEPT